MIYQDSIAFFILVLCFLKRIYIAESVFTKFTISFSKYLFFSLVQISYSYIKLIIFLFAIYKAFFITNLVPSIIQVMVIFNYSFNYVWDAYLLLVVYVSALWCFPCYVYQFINEKLFKISVQFEINVIISLSFFYFFNLENFFYCLVNLYYFDLHIFNKNRNAFLDEAEFYMQSKCLTQKSLKELASFVKENYDSSVSKIKAKKR